jgi:hypothetical protein
MAGNGRSERELERKSRGREDSAGCLRPIVESCLVVLAVGLLVRAPRFDEAGQELAVELAASVLLFAALSIAFGRRLRTWVLVLALAVGIGGMAAGVGAGNTYGSSVAINVGAGLAVFVVLETWLALALKGITKWERGWRDFFSSDFDLSDALERMAAEQSSSWWGYTLDDELADEPADDGRPEKDA